MMQITNIRYHDNGSPQAALPDFIRRWNEGNADPARSGSGSARSRTSSTACAPSPRTRLPMMRGDWTDWWNFGAGSTAHETAQALQGQRDLDEALGARCLAPGRKQPRRRAMLHDTARGGLALYAEHTWGADRSISQS